MGNKLFGVNISKLIKDNVGTGVLNATLTVYTSGSRGAQLTGGTNPTSQDYPCKGFIDNKAVKDRSGTLVDDGTVTIVLIGDTISGGSITPSVGDAITIEGTKFGIEVIDRDPAAATYTCVSRKV